MFDISSVPTGPSSGIWISSYEEAFKLLYSPLYLWMYWFLLTFLFFFFRRFDLYGLYCHFGAFGAWKTLRLATILKKYTRRRFKNYVRIANFYSPYNDLSIMSSTDFARFWIDLNEFHNNVREWHNSPPWYFESMKLTRKEQYALRVLQRERFLQEFPWVDDFDFSSFCVFDETGIYFNNRNFATNFEGDKKALMQLMYQPRKLKLICHLIIQNISDLEVKWRRLINEWVEYSSWLWFLRFSQYLYVPDPDNLRMEDAKVLKTNWHFHFMPKYPYFKGLQNFLRYPKAEYYTDEIIGEIIDIYKPWDVIRFILSRPDRFKVRNNPIKWYNRPISSLFTRAKPYFTRSVNPKGTSDERSDIGVDVPHSPIGE